MWDQLKVVWKSFYLSLCRDQDIIIGKYTVASICSVSQGQSFVLFWINCTLKILQKELKVSNNMAVFSIETFLINESSY